MRLQAVGGVAKPIKESSVDERTRYVARHSDRPNSRGSRTYNQLYAELNLNALYLQFAGVQAEQFLSSMKSLGFLGSTVVGSLARDLVPFLDELDPSARRAGAVNTITFHGGTARGYKTDGVALITALKEITELSAKTVAIAGAGRLVEEIIPLLEESNIKSVSIFNRSEDRGRSLANRLDSSFGGSLDRLEEVEADILINATPVGARGIPQARLISKKRIPNFGAILDTSFDPPDTSLIQEARSLKIPNADGLRMFAYQGVAQVRHYFQIEASVSRLEELITDELVS
jgi:shikimate dehydrogenase